VNGEMKFHLKWFVLLLTWLATEDLQEKQTVQTIHKLEFVPLEEHEI
jgi:hypothetical protein